ncbi:hypothetical protein DLAC_03597 [Tieghemostelium lacteum]|uniref:Uncharacterized protein n=1 Tax=Tieghemostelium lacteum TaxID=361077 RepID=A0A152A0C1_TIELA|nr:hypothetical protein DLAC_03597 [Tieghemostelium lacteum]|eukprot:KYQ99659.1 hypothetical protein DLAC_03597 [Tieghemostelium lacteum]
MNNTKKPKNIIDFVQKISGITNKNSDGFFRTVVLKLLSAYCTFRGCDKKSLVYLENSIDSIIYNVKIPNDKIVFHIAQSITGGDIDGGIVLVDDSEQHQLGEYQEDLDESGNILTLIAMIYECYQCFQKRFGNQFEVNQPFLEMLREFNDTDNRPYGGIGDLLRHPWLDHRKVLVKILGDRVYKEFEITIQDVKDILQGNLRSLTQKDISHYKLFIEYLNSSLIYPLLNGPNQLPYFTAEIIYLIDFQETPIPPIEKLTNFQPHSVTRVTFANDTQSYATKTLSEIVTHLSDFKNINELFKVKVEVFNELVKLLEKLELAEREKIDYSKLKLSVENNINELVFKYKSDKNVVQYLGLINDNNLEAQLKTHYNSTQDKEIIGNCRQKLQTFINYDQRKLELLEKSKGWNHTMDKMIGDLRDNLTVSYGIYSKLRDSLDIRIAPIRNQVKQRLMESILYHMNQDKMFFSGLELDLEFQAYQLQSLISNELMHRKRFEQSMSFYKFPLGFQLPSTLFMVDDEENSQYLVNPLSGFIKNESEQYEEAHVCESLMLEHQDILRSMIELDTNVLMSKSSPQVDEILSVLYKIVDDNELITDVQNVEIGEENQETVKMVIEENEQLKNEKEYYSEMDFSEELMKYRTERNTQLQLEVTELQEKVKHLEQQATQDATDEQFKEIMNQLDGIKMSIEGEMEVLQENIQQKSDFLQKIQDLEKEAKDLKKEELILQDECEIFKKRITDLMKSYDEKRSSIQKQLVNFDKEIQVQQTKLKTLDAKLKLAQTSRKDLDSTLIEKLNEKIHTISKLNEDLASYETILDLQNKGE